MKTLKELGYTPRDYIRKGGIEIPLRNTPATCSCYEILGTTRDIGDIHGMVKWCKHANATSIIATVLDGDEHPYKELGFDCTFLGLGREGDDLWLCTKRIHGEGSELPE